MDRLKDDCTKADELAHFRRFVCSVPSHSYLGIALAGADAQLEKMLADDYSFELLPALQRGRAELREEISQLTKERNAMAAKIAQLKKEAQDVLARTVRARDYAADSIRAVESALADLRKAHESSRAFCIDSLLK